MKQAGLLIYIIATRAYFFLLYLLTPFHKKAELFVNGRNALLEKIGQKLSSESRKRIWFHCASLGEFEQAKPVMEAIKIKYPDSAIVLTFFSPSESFGR